MLYVTGCSCPVCTDDLEMTGENRTRVGCKYCDVRPDVIRLHDVYRTYMEPVPLSPYEPASAARANLIELPYRLREVAALVDYWRGKSHTQQLNSARDKREQREVMKKAGIPL